MWIITTEGFFSINRTDKTEPGSVQVRARLQEHLVTLLKKIGYTHKEMDEIIEYTSPYEGNDYAWRVTVPRSRVGKYLADYILNLDYSNVKNRIASTCPELSRGMGSLWGHFMEVQDDDHLRNIYK